MPKLISSDAPLSPLGRSSGVQAINGANISDQAFNVANQAIQQTGQNLSNSISQQAQTYNASVQSSEQVNSTIAKSESVTTDGGSGFAKGLEAITHAGKLVVNTLDKIEKQKEKERKAYDEDQLNRATMEVEQLKVDAQEAMQNKVSGRAGLEAQFHSIIKNYGLNSKTAAELYKSFYGTLAPLENAYTSKIVKEQEEIEQNKRSKETSIMRVNLSASLARIGNSDDPDKVNAGITDFETTLGKFMSSTEITQMDRSHLMASAYKALEDSVGMSSAARAKLSEKLGNWQKFDAEAATARKEYETTGDKVLLDARIARLSDMYGVSSGVAQTYDPLYALEQANKIEKVRTDGVDLVKKGAMQRQDAMNLDDMTVGSVAQALAADPGKYAKFKQQNGEGATGKQVLAVADAMNDYKQLKVKLTREESEVLIAKQALRTGKAEDFFNYWKTFKPSDNSLIPPWMQQYQALAGREPMNTKDPAYAQQLEEWRAKMNDAFEEVKSRKEDAEKFLDLKLSGTQQELSDKMKSLSNYGITQDGTFDRPSYEAGLARYNKVLQEQKAQDGARQTIGNGGQTPPFRQPQLKRISVGGRQTVLPVAPTVDVSISGNFMEQRSTHKHQGLDLAMEVGTPVMSAQDGKVIRAGNIDPNGYGNVVEVQMADGTYHLYAHVSKVNVKVGDTVRAGQVVALSGGEPGAPGAGSSGGAHVHWEVRDKDEQVIDPSSWGNTQPVASVRARSGDVKTSRPSNVPKDAIPVSGGYLAHVDGRLKFVSDAGKYSAKPVSYTNSAPLRANYASSKNLKTTATDPDRTYGYSALKNREFNQALHDVASEAGIPGQWLADVIAHETDGTFSPSIKNYGGAPAVGLIQFYDDEGRPGGKTIGNRYYTRSEMANMSPVQQIRLVGKYLNDVGATGKMKSLEDLASAVFTGAVGRKSRELSDYVSQVGRHAGRKYDTNDRGRRAQNKIDTQLRAGCPMCAQMAALGTFTPHERMS